MQFQLQNITIVKKKFALHCGLIFFIPYLSSVLVYHGQTFELQNEYYIIPRVGYSNHNAVGGLFKHKDLPTAFHYHCFHSTIIYIAGQPLKLYVWFVVQPLNSFFFSSVLIPNAVNVVGCLISLQNLSRSLIVLYYSSIKSNHSSCKKLVMVLVKQDLSGR